MAQLDRHHTPTLSDELCRARGETSDIEPSTIPKEGRRYRVIYSPANAMAELLAKGLGAHQTTVEAIDQRLAAAIARAPEAAAQGLTIETVFADGALASAGLAELRRMVGNCSLKPEPVISQLRRAEAAFIEAHHQYLEKGHSDLRLAELRWAVLRVSMARQFYDGLVQALPPATRSVRPVRTPTAVRDFTINDFSEEEQDALELALDDRHGAIRKIETILGSGRASGDGIRLFVGYLMDTSREAEVNGWLTALRRTRHGQRASAQTDIPPDEAGASGGPSRPSKFHIPAPSTVPSEAGERVPDQVRSQVPNPIADNAATDTQQTRVALATLRSWLDASWQHIGAKFQDRDGLLQFGEPIKVPKYAEAYKVAGLPPEFQAEVRARLSGDEGS